MSKYATMAALAALVTVTMVADAGAWTRNSSTTTWRGTTSTTATGQCAGGTCSRNVVRTGPYGNTASGGGTATCSNGVCNSSGYRTGPYGNTVQRSGTISR